MQKQKRVCPECGRSYSAYPAISRKDNSTEICPNCGLAEALSDSLFNSRHSDEESH